MPLQPSAGNQQCRNPTTVARLPHHTHPRPAQLKHCHSPPTPTPLPSLFASSFLAICSKSKFSNKCNATARAINSAQLPHSTTTTTSLPTTRRRDATLLQKSTPKNCSITKRSHEPIQVRAYVILVLPLLLLVSDIFVHRERVRETTTQQLEEETYWRHARNTLAMAQQHFLERPKLVGLLHTIRFARVATKLEIILQC